MSLAPARADVPHRVGPAKLKQPDTIRCKPSRPSLPSSQAPSSDAVPHRIDSCRATPAAAVRCKQTDGNKRRPLATNNHASASTWGNQHPSSMSSSGDADSGQVAKDSEPSTEPSVVARDNASKEGTTPMAPPSLVQKLDRVYTQRPRVAGL